MRVQRIFSHLRSACILTVSFMVISVPADAQLSPSGVSGAKPQSTAQPPAENRPAHPAIDEPGANQQPRKQRSVQAEGKREARLPKLNFHLWLGALRAVELTTQQQMKIREIVQKFHEAQQAFEAEYGTELRQLLREARDVRAVGGTIDLELRERIVKLREKEPPVVEYQSRIWMELNRQQQQQMRQQLEKTQRLLAKRRAALQLQQPQRERSRAPGAFSPEDAADELDADELDELLGDDSSEVDPLVTPPVEQRQPRGARTPQERANAKNNEEGAPSPQSTRRTPSELTPQRAPQADAGPASTQRSGVEGAVEPPTQPPPNKRKRHAADQAGKRG